MAGRLQLVRAVIQSMLIYSITLYSWPTSLIKELEKNIRNFVWSGEIDKRKLVTVSWKKVCRPLSQGGLNLRSLSSLNKASNLKLCWTMLNSKKAWAQLLLQRVLRGRRFIQHHIYSSLWSSFKDEVNTILENSICLLGNGEDINFWTDNWCGVVLSDMFNIPPPPLINWLKCNIDGAAKGNPGLASCGGIFRNHEADMIYCFAEPLGTASAFQAELCGAMRAIEVAHNRNWKNIWWNNVKLLLRQMNCKCLIFLERGIK
ncbi:hypothetical protein TSUD_77130 [Trifolium subterraneum]|uniref:RNase H type-1 domain-containing protein n=1 Tax=Trifolium subterraneum TaxID=3900 RepID=A0A2Z6LMU5_TRISU|nr:hypothetical protein TSUD_77130 [Trifolium subterraneum]